jgi:hypothetical protein
MLSPAYAWDIVVVADANTGLFESGSLVVPHAQSNMKLKTHIILKTTPHRRPGKRCSCPSIFPDLQLTECIYPIPRYLYSLEIVKSIAWADLMISNEALTIEPAEHMIFTHILDHPGLFASRQSGYLKDAA